MLNAVTPGQLLKEEALAAYKKGDFDRAIVILQTGVTLLPQSPDVRELLGLSLMGLGRFEEAAAALAEAAKLFTLARMENPRVFNNLGVALLRAGKFHDARTPLENALRLKPDTPGTRLNLAKVLIKVGQVPDAMRHLDYLLANVPPADENYTTRGIALSMLGRLPEAIAELRKSLDRAPTPQAYECLMLALRNSAADPREIHAASTLR